MESYGISIDCLMPCKFWRNSNNEVKPLGNFPWSLYLSSNFCVFPAVQSNDHFSVFLVFCNPLFYTYILIKILRFFYSYVFTFMRFKGMGLGVNFPAQKSQTIGRTYASSAPPSRLRRRRRRRASSYSSSFHSPSLALC